VTRPTVTTEVLDATPTGHCTEFLYDDGANDELIACAAHGGGVEPGTAEQAIELATGRAEATCWARLGYDEGTAFEEYHPASTAIGPGDHPLLSAVADRGFDTVVSFHGLADEGVLVGGGIDAETKRTVARRLDAAVTPAAAVASESAYAGVSPENFVNWLAAGEGGLQIEQGPRVRSEESEAVRSVVESLLEEGRI
jgi:phage replication-related protein YjqB (UPF0714/DUF867 family)